MLHESFDEFVFGSVEPVAPEVVAAPVVPNSISEVVPSHPETTKVISVSSIEAEEAAFISALRIEAWNSALALARCMKQRDKSNLMLLEKTYRLKKKSTKVPVFSKPMSALTI